MYKSVKQRPGRLIDKERIRRSISRTGVTLASVPDLLETLVSPPVPPHLLLTVLICNLSQKIFQDFLRNLQ